MLRHILLQDTAEPQELLQETILLQEVFLTAHMAKAYEFPTPVRRSQTFKGWPDNSHGLLSMQLLPHRSIYGPPITAYPRRGILLNLQKACLGCKSIGCFWQSGVGVVLRVPEEVSMGVIESA